MRLCQGSLVSFPAMQRSIFEREHEFSLITSGKADAGAFALYQSSLTSGSAP
jgi:hypothetical protein